MFAFWLFLLSLSGLVAGFRKRHNSILNFPSASTANYISLNPDMPDVTGLTVCGWQKKAYSDAGRYWFSYATPGSDNEIILGERAAGEYVFYLGGSNYGVTVGAPENQWVHVCATWDSASGVSTISVNGEIKKTQVNFKKGSRLRPLGNLVIGQEQDSVGGGFDAKQAFVGKLTGINVWHYALDASEIAFIYKAGICGYSTTAKNPMISYEYILMNTHLHGDVTLSEERSCMDLEDPSDGQVLRFPPQSEASTANYLQFTPDFGTDEFLEFSICTWFFKTYGDQSRYFFSYAQSGLDNSIILGEAATLGIWVDNSRMLTDIYLAQQRWYHLCFTWASDSTSAIYVDGEKVKEGDLARGKTKTSGGVLNIGQEQDSVGGGYDANQAFAGSLYNLNMFNIKLTDEQVSKVYANGAFCKKVPDEFWKAGSLMIAYKDLYSVVPDGFVYFDDGEEAWRYGAMHCDSMDLDEDAHKPDCWVMEENIEYKNKRSRIYPGYVVGTVDEAKAACYASGTCKTLTCYEEGGVNRCDMKSSFRKAIGDKKTSYTYRC